MLVEYDRACQDRDGMQGKVRELVYRAQKLEELKEERDDTIQ